MSPKDCVQLIDALTIGVFLMLVLSILAANGRLRPLCVMLGCIGCEVCFTFAARFWSRESWMFSGLHFAGRVLELIGVALYLYRSRRAEES